MLKKYYPLLFLILLFKCQSNLNLEKNPTQNLPLKYSRIDSIEIKNWHTKDIIYDSLPGVSLDKAYYSILKDLKGENIIVAILDNPIAINHEDLRNNIWINTSEIDNDLDDDDNGYIDDFHGWNFLGNYNGDNNRFVSQEYIRILRKHLNVFFKKDSISILNFKEKDLYIKAKEKYLKQLKYFKEDTAYINMVEKSKRRAEHEIQKYFKRKDFSSKDLDSLAKKHYDNGELQNYILSIKNFKQYGYSDDFIENYKYKSKEKLDKLVNINYNDRLIIGDNPNDITNYEYGNNSVNSDVEFLDHGTKMAGLIAGKRGNNIGVEGFSNKIKIMPLCVSAYGDEHDKDIALAIKYAVNNGAKVINMSFSKEFSLHPEWVFDAIKYAEKNNVLIVTSAGNSNSNLNSHDDLYPNDNMNNDEEITDNFLMVGASTYNANENLLSPFSNYGSMDVDIFAPGHKIYTTSAKEEKYELINGGTSASSAITSGIAALLFSYYPDLTASQVKQILIDSGVEYTFPVKVRVTGTKKDTLIPFNQLSKSGKIVNAYNALIMADSISKAH